MPSTEIVLKLGDIIELIAPTNPNYHQKSYFIAYIDDETLEILDIINGFKHKLDIASTGYFTDESITQLALLSRAPDGEEGYARQNGLVVGQWIDIHFGGELPTIITGEISNLDEDMIEIITYPDTETIYIDFAYKGIPKWLPITDIVTRDKPDRVKHSLRAMVASAEEADTLAAERGDEVATLTQSPDGDMLINIPDKPLMDTNINEVMRELVFNIKDVVFGSEEEIMITREVKKSEQRYGLDIQLNDLFDELLSTIPNHKRTTHVMNRVNTIVKRFKELREQFSTFDENGNVTGYKNFDAAYKPLKEHMQSLDCCLRWILPVVKQQTKLYEVPAEFDNDAISKESIVQDLIDYQQIKELHKNSYEEFYNGIDPLLKPFTSEGQEVKTDLEVIVDGMEDYYNFAVKQVRDQMEVLNRRFTMQKYNLGLSKMHQHTMKSGKTIYLRGPMTLSDAANIKTWLMLPQQAVEFSRIDMPGTSIAQKCSLSQNWLYYHRFLRSGTRVRNYNASVPINYEKEAANTFLTTVSDFTTDDKTTLLDNMIPRSRAVINLMREHVKHPYSFYSMMAYYEPFFIRPDTIVYGAKTLDDKQKNIDVTGGGSYQEIRYHVKEQVKLFKANFAQIGAEFGDMAIAKYDYEPKTLPNKIQLKTSENADNIATLYSMTPKARESETINNMLALDGGAAYTAAASAMLSMLYKPDLTKIFDPASIEKHVSKSCATRSLVKRYKSVRDMQKDNNETEVFVDKEFDNTPYDIMKKYAEDQKKMAPEEFLDYLKIVLIEKHGANMETVAALAKNLIAKRTLVQNGNYALLEIKPTGSSEEGTEAEANARAKKSYYVRRKNTWVREDIDDETFCNLSPQCIVNTDKKGNSTCETAASAEHRIAIKGVNDVASADRIDIMLDLTMEDLNAELSSRLKYRMDVLKKIRWIKESNKKQHTLYAHALGTQHAEVNITLSPFLKLRDHILELRDIAERSANLVRFREHFCREAVRSDTVNESDAWFYCIDTNSKLLPKFLYELAYVFVVGGDYEATLDAICRRQGKMSEDLDSIVDKHSGYVIKYVDYAEDEGFNDQGFRISTRDIITQDAADMLESGLTNADTIVFRKDNSSGRKIFENTTTQHVYNISRALCDYTGVDFAAVEDRVLSLTSEFIKILDTPEMYEAKREKAAKKNIKIASYETYYDQNKIYYTACVTFVCIQTAIPSFKPKKTFPGCMFSFAGYPLDQVEENVMGLKYFACIIENIKSSIAPWNSIANQKKDTILSRMMELMTKRVTLNPDIQHLINKKRASANIEDDVVPLEHDIKKWVHFQPPIVPFSLKGSMGTLSPEFKEELSIAMKKGNVDTTSNMIGTVYQKIIASTYGVIETINKEVAVAGKEALLRAGTLVFLENACCAGKGSALDYFKDKDDIIIRLIASVVQNSSIFHDTKTICRAPYLFYTNFKGRVIPSPQKDFIEELVYECFIKYCNLDNDMPTPDDLLKFYPEKPSLDKNMDLLQTIDALKKLGHNHNLNSFADLMQTLARRNTINLYISPAPPARKNISAFEDLIEHAVKSNTIEKSMGKHIQTLIELYNTSAVSEDAINALKRHLLKSNRALLKVIETFIKDFDVAFKTSTTKKLLESLTNYGVWKGDQHNLYGYFQNTVFTKTKMLPSIICNGHNPTFASMKHWELSPLHREEIERFCTNYYKQLKSFENDMLLCNFFMDADLQERLINLNMMSENIPVFDHETELFDRETMQLLYTYINYSILYEIIICSDKDEFTKQMMGLEVSATPDADLISGEKPNFKKRICSLITTIVNMDALWKNTINVTYDELHDKVFKASKLEKKTITGRFETMSQDERNVEFMLKKYKMGMWNVGEEKGIYKYDAKTYDREVTGAMAANTMDVDELRAYDDAIADEAADREAYDISGLDEDYTDGVYYSEDANQD